jgi:tight adherence protein B
MTASALALTLLAGAALVSSSSSSSPRARLTVTVRRGRLPAAVMSVVAPTTAVLVAATVSPGLALAAAVLWSTGVRRHRRRRAARARRLEGRIVAAALEVLVGELRAGANPVDAFAVASAESSGQVAGILLTVASRARLGADVATGLREAAKSSAAPTSWERVASYWHLAADHGLAMATLMSAAQHDITSRQRFGDGVHAGLAGARATAGILAALPVIGLLLGGLIGAHPISFLLGGPVGGVLLAAGAGLMCGGLIWSDSIIDGVAR